MTTILNGHKLNGDQEDLLQFVLETTFMKWEEDLPGQQMIFADHPELCNGKFMEHAGIQADLLNELRTLKDMMTNAEPAKQ